MNTIKAVCVLVQTVAMTLGEQELVAKLVSEIRRAGYEGAAWPRGREL